MIKIKLKNIPFIIVYLVVVCSCLTKKQNRGFVSPGSTDTNLNFTTSKTVVILPGTLNGENKSFLFDTGADLSLINREKITGRKSKVTGAGGKKVSLGSETLHSLKIGDISFEKTYAYTDKMTYFDTIIPNFGGLIGQSIISKANWLIDYPKNMIKISEKPIETIGFEVFKMANVRAPKIDIQLEGETISAAIDLGSSTALAIPISSEISTKLIAKYTFTDNTREVYRAGGSETISEKVAIIPLIKFGSLVAKNVEVKIYNTQNIRIGNAFFKDHQLYIDNTNGFYKFK